MFAQFTAPRASAAQMMSGLYRQVGVQTGVETATPHQLVAMLYDGFLESLARARGALQAGDIDAKCRAVTRAARILDEGLKAGLRPEGGELANNLANLYSYVANRLMQAHARNDLAALDECRALIEPLRDAWTSIGAQIPSQMAA